LKRKIVDDRRFCSNGRVTSLAIETFVPEFSTSAMEELRNRLRRTRWPDELPDSGWVFGTNLKFMHEICDYWATEFDWDSQIERFKTFPQFKAAIAGQEIHFLHLRGESPQSLPLILTHGWPGSFMEFLRILPMLTEPTKYGAAAADCFDVIVPSLPGYGYSGKPGRGMNSFAVADCWAQLMTGLGYQRFAAQGGDIGAGVTTALGLRYPDRLIALHLNYVPGSYRPFLAPGTSLTEEEQIGLKQGAQWVDQHGAYAHMQRTTPLTPAYALHDSPIGLAAWILEKFQKWSDCNGDPRRAISIDELLANVTLYWMTETVHSSFRMYFENALAPLAFGESDFINVPCAIAHFPKEIFLPPRSWVERGYNVQRWTEMPRGGHFAAWEQPELLAHDLRTFFRSFR
jgi:pimeloyl-ACP methyl ester carboxylesterase